VADQSTGAAPLGVTHLRDFMVFEQHVKAARARRGAEVPAEWYEAPTYYHGTATSLLGSGVDLAAPTWTEKLDFELELACIVGSGGSNIVAADAEAHIAGLTIFNDWSARDVQRREMAVGLGPSKSKDFAGSVGPRLVQLAELAPYRVEAGRWRLEMVARINGCEVTRGNAVDMRWSFAEIIEHASRDCALMDGELLGSGTVGGGCLLELGPGARPGADGVPGSDGHDWLQPGDLVELEIEHIGVLATRIA
jgi:fumarylacetoacetate (FAA) hydrolase